MIVASQDELYGVKCGTETLVNQSPNSTQRKAGFHHVLNSVPKYLLQKNTNLADSTEL